jgi:hypothetical protein
VSADPLDELRRIIASPEFQRDVERSANFLTIAEEENKRVEVESRQQLAFAEQ